MSHSEGEGGRKDRAEDKGESTVRARFVAPTSSRPWLSLQLEITQLILSLSPAATTAPNNNLFCSSNSKLSMQNNQLGNFSNPDYPGLLRN